MLLKGAKGKLAEGALEQGEMYQAISGGGNDSHVTQLLYGAGPPLVNSAGVPWTAAYIDTIGDPTSDLRSNIAAESRAKLIYERLIGLTPDPGVREALGFLMTREIAHQKSFEKALYSIEPNFPPGKLPGDPRFTDKYYDMSQGDGNARGPWNEGPQWDYVDQRAEQYAVDGGDGSATVKLKADERDALKAAARRTRSTLNGDPMTGADLGAGPGAGSTTDHVEPRS
jgi:Mn-containing catalase